MAEGNPYKLQIRPIRCQKKRTLPAPDSSKLNNESEINEKSCRSLGSPHYDFGADGTRTHHFQIANLTLYQMSYSPIPDIFNTLCISVSMRKTRHDQTIEAKGPPFDEAFHFKRLISEFFTSFISERRRSQAFSRSLSITAVTIFLCFPSKL